MANSYKKVIALGLDYSEFQGGIKDCTEEMKKLDSEHKALSSEMENVASGSDKLAEKNEYLTKKIELQNKKVQLAKEKLEELKNSESATESQVRKATIAFNNETAELNKLNNELTDNAVEMSNVKASATALVTALTAVSTAAIACVKSAAEYADELKTLSEQTGVAVDTLQAWDYASELIDTDFNTMTSSLQKLEKTMASSPETFRELGISITDSTGHMRSAEEVFYRTIDALKNIKNETEKDQIAMEIFGKSADELTGVINTGSKGLQNYKNEAQALGLILSQEEVDAAAEAQDAFDQLTKSLEVAKMKIGSQLAPVISAFAKAISSIPAPTLAAAAAVASLIVVVVLLITTIASVVRAFNTISSAIGLATGAMNPQLLMVVALVAALALLAYAIKEIIELYKQWRMEQEQLNRATENLQVGISKATGKGSGGRGSSKHNATGTKNWEGGSTWVGENGPEIVDLPAGTRIYNNNESKQLSSPTYNISMNVDITKLKSVNDVVEAVQGLGMSASVGGAV